MQNILVIHSSLNQDEGNSAQLASHLGQHLASKYSAQLHSEHLYAQDLPHLTSNEMQAWMTSTDDRTQTQQELAAISDAYIAQVMTADTIVIGMPMYNFGVPSAFKAWIDRIARAGVTFKYTDQGPVGLLKDKKIIVVAARGGMYQGTPLDTQTKYLQDFFGFLGLQDVDFIYAEGLAMPDKEQSIASAMTQIEKY